MVIKKSGLLGKFKPWLYQHGLLPRLMWLLTVYEVLITCVEGVERKINKYLRKWLGIRTAPASSVICGWNRPKRKITWADLWRLEPFRISFLLRSVYDTLPTPTNLHKWDMREDSLCKLCGERGTMAQIMSGCKTALTQGSYRWHHDKVLMKLANTLEQERKKKCQPLQTTTSIEFVREGKTAANRSNNKNQFATKGPIIGNEGRPWRKAQVPPDCQDNPEAGYGTVVRRGKKGHPHRTYSPM